MSFRRQWATPGPSEGFSLTEVVLALGIVAFAIVALLGLLSASLGTSRVAEDETRLAAITSDVIDTLRSRPFADVPIAATYEFDHDGERLTSTGGEPYYQCVLSTTTDTSTTNSTQTNLLSVRMIFTWPAGVNPPPNQRSVHASLSRK
jgi:uncharacterized protein (TIGR02598 family)